MSPTPVASDAAQTAPAAAWPTVTLCIPTFRRPLGLELLLDHVARLSYPGRLKVLVVDNDAEAQAGLAVVERRREGFPFPMRGVLEATRGQTYAYNRAFTLAATEEDASDLVAILDDDEYPAADWLTLMVDALRTYDAGIVGGPVLPVFDDPDHWMARTNLFNPLRFPTGPVSVIYGAGSMIIRRDVLMPYLDEPFSNELAFTGGSDIDFFHRCRRDGVRFAWADEAIVLETVPTTRMQVGWLLRRSFRAGTDLGRVARKYQPGRKAAALRWAKGPGLVAVSLAQIPVSALFGKGRIVRTLMNTARGVGRIASEFDLRYEEYRRIHGR
ncbi:glycosyltransferase [Salinarimonas soli]|uniref:Glycosyltransferase family 2 protein n=1 Tax=Salinarimonas soli TaxID=1638099 RepID=A0A5B2W1P7_9HYPH|nr:glycosyltransferase [Salinarimonas soli]KAA2244387.1 glycosyltransferase family 2 protein [Salinarimonas soli]